MEHHLCVTGAGSTGQRVGPVGEDRAKKVSFALVKIRFFVHEPQCNVLHVRVLKSFINLRSIILVKITGLTVAPLVPGRTQVVVDLCQSLPGNLIPRLCFIEFGQNNGAFLGKFNKVT